jgi:hypothetical protein
MNSPLHLKKIEILTRLIKDEAITMHEALLLLKEEDLDQDSYEYLLNDSSYWTKDLTNRVIYFDGDVSN